MNPLSPKANVSKGATLLYLSLLIGGSPFYLTAICALIVSYFKGFVKGFLPLFGLRRGSSHYSSGWSYFIPLTMIVYHRLYQKSTEIFHEFRRDTSKPFSRKNLAPLTLTVKGTRYIYQLMSINAAARPIASIGSFSKMSSSILIMVSGAI